MIWLIGDKGMLGAELSQVLSAAGLPFVGTDREVSILESEALRRFASGRATTWIINCAAYTAVDRAEEEPELCARLNAEGPEKLGRLAASLGARVLHLSTDYVFDGNGTRPYLESDPVSPIGVYGKTKAEGEARLLAAAPDSIVLRTSWLYGRQGPNFVDTMLRLMGERERLGVVADQEGSPTWARDLSLAIADILKAEAAPGGVYHYTNSGETSWHGFALAIEREGRAAGLLARPCLVEPLTTAQYPTKAHRPAYSVLSKEKIKKTFGLSIPAWEESLKAHLAELARG